MYLEGTRITPFLTYLKPFLEGGPFTKVVKYDPWDTMMASETTLRNLLSSTTPFRGHKDTPNLDIVRAISGRRPFYKSC